jgi:DNA-binding winged helix-turn-helix (wHTH) protein
MHAGCFRFENFTLDAADRQLTRNGEPVELNGRYFDALALLVRERGRLVSKDRFLDEVWRGVPVTDEALTQCVRTLRRQLGDDAARPRFIETVPKHGYRFIAEVQQADAVTAPGARRRSSAISDAAVLAAAGTIGAGLAGFLGGLVYGFAGASQPLQPGMGAMSVLLVLMSLTILVALIGGAGVSAGIAAAELVPKRRWYWPVLGGALGGLVVGAAVKFLGLDAFNLLLGHSPGDITGPFEGVALGGAVGLGVWLGSAGAGRASLRRSALVAALTGGAAGVVIALLGGRMMGGSLDLLARSFPSSRLRLDQIGALLGESGFGPVSQAVTSGLEAALFGGCVAAAMLLVRRSRQMTR